MSSPKRRQPLGVQIAAVQQAHRLLESNIKLIRGLTTLADRAYVLDGLTSARETLEWMRDNEAAIRAAFSAVKAAEVAAKSPGLAAGEPVSGRAA